MMNRSGNIRLLTLGVLATVAAAAPASASDKQDFETCDGRIDPGKQDDGMRGLAGTQRFRSSDTTAGDVDACTRALASPRLLPTQSLRRAHLLRARAAAYLSAGNAAVALADIDAAEAATAPLAADRFYQRSMGVSLTLLRALAHVQAGDTAAALPLARSAIAARPYSVQIQQVGTEILHAARTPGSNTPSPWLPLTRLDPDLAATALIKEAEIGNYPGVLALATTTTPKWPAAPVGPMAFVVRSPEASALMSAMLMSLHVAYARAATGDATGAKNGLAQVRAKVAAALRPADAPAAASDKTPPLAALPPMASSLIENLNKYIDARARQIDARVAVTEKRPMDALTALVAAPMPRDAATVELLRALKTALPAKEAALVPDLTQFEADFARGRRPQAGTLAAAILIAPETPRAVLDYGRARPKILGALIGDIGTGLLGGLLGGTSRAGGFRSTDNPDGTIRVEFIGNTPSAALVQEMTLLRAAEVTRAAGKPAFVITGRTDYARRLARMQYGSEISSTPTGFKTELTIRCVDAAAEENRALDAVTVIDTLGPLYYEEKKAG